MSYFTKEKLISDIKSLGVMKGDILNVKASLNIPPKIPPNIGGSGVNITRSSVLINCPVLFSTSATKIISWAFCPERLYLCKNC